MKELDCTKKEGENISFLFEYIQANGSENLSKLFRINFLKIDEIQKEYISIVYNCFEDVSAEVLELKGILKSLNYRGTLFI